MTTVTVYGKITCEDTIRSRAFLDKHEVPYTWVDVEKNLEGRRIAIQKNPKNRLNTPTIVFQDGCALVEPSDEQLAEKLGIRRSGMKRKLFILTLWLFLGFSGQPLLCAEPSREVLTFAYAAISPAVLPLWIAGEKGFFAKEGIDVRPVYVRGSPVLLSSMASGEVQAGYTAGTAALSAASRGLDLQIVVSIINKITYDIVTRPEIITPADIRGKTFGVNALGGTVWMSAMLGLEYLGLDPARDKIKIIALGDQTILVQALEKRAIDVTVLDKPLSTSMEKRGFRVLTELYKVNIPFTSPGIVFPRSFIAQKPEIVERTVRAIVRAMGYLFDQRNKPEVVAYMIRKLSLDPATAELGYEPSLERLNRKLYPTVEGLRNIQRFLSRFNPDVSKVAIERLVDTKFLEKLDKSRFIDEVYRTGGQAP